MGPDAPTRVSVAVATTVGVFGRPPLLGHLGEHYGLRSHDGCAGAGYSGGAGGEGRRQTCIDSATACMATASIKLIAATWTALF